LSVKNREIAGKRSEAGHGSSEVVQNTRKQFLLRYLILSCEYFTISVSSVLLFFRRRSEGWPHHGRTFSILSLSSVVLTDSSTGEFCPRLDVVESSLESRHL